MVLSNDASVTLVLPQKSHGSEQFSGLSVGYVFGVACLLVLSRVCQVISGVNSILRLQGLLCLLCSAFFFFRFPFPFWSAPGLVAVRVRTGKDLLVT